MIKHFCVSVYVFNPKSKNFLMVNHKKLGKWVQPGGHIELNEDPEEASLREVFEETGLTLNSYKFRGIVTFLSDDDPMHYDLLPADAVRIRPLPGLYAGAEGF